MSLTPTVGARFLLERELVEGPRATYRATIFTPDATFSTVARLAEDGALEVEPSGAPGELHDMLTMQARLVARGAAKRREDGLAVWPARLLRWRGPGR